MKKLFTLIAAALVTIGVSAQKQTLLSFTITDQSVLAGEDNQVNTVTGGTVALHVSELKTVEGTGIGASLNSESKYIEVKLDEKLQAGDIINVSYFAASNPQTENTDGVNILNEKTGAEGSNILATGYCTVAGKKTIQTVSYIAQGDEKKFIVERVSTSGTVCFQKVEVTRGSDTYVMDFSALCLDTQAKAEAAIENVEYLTITTSDPDPTTGETQALWNSAAGQTASWTFKGFPVSVSYRNSSAKNGFCKSGKDYFQFNNTGSYVNITCNVGQYIIITPTSYSKDGSFDITGGVNNSDQTAKISIPKETTDNVVVKATAATVSLKCTGACRWGKVEISDKPTPSAISSVSASSSKSNNGVIKTANYIIKNGKKYNFAGQLVK